MMVVFITSADRAFGPNGVSRNNNTGQPRVVADRRRFSLVSFTDSPAVRVPRLPLDQTVLAHWQADFWRIFGRNSARRHLFVHTRTLLAR